MPTSPSKVSNTAFARRKALYAALRQSCIFMGASLTLPQPMPLSRYRSSPHSGLKGGHASFMPDHISHIGWGSNVEKQCLGSPNALHCVYAALRDGHKIPRLN